MNKYTGVCPTCQEQGIGVVNNGPDGFVLDYHTNQINETCGGSGQWPQWTDAPQVDAVDDHQA